MSTILVRALRSARSLNSQNIYGFQRNREIDTSNRYGASVVASRNYSFCPETFTDGEIKFYYAQFIKHDKDRDGLLSRWELNELFREKYERQLNSSDLEKMLMAMGVKYCDNKISFTQYMTLLQKRFAQKYCVQELIQLFDLWDKNTDGLLDWPEFRRAVGYLGFDPDHPELLCRFQKSDRDMDDMIDFEEFVEVVETLPCLPKRA